MFPTKCTLLASTAISIFFSVGFAMGTGSLESAGLSYVAKTYNTDGALHLKGNQRPAPVQLAQVSATNPCSPCNPCAAGGGNFSMKCAVPRLVTAALCNPCAPKCNPCAVKNPCNPCAAKNPCNPCAAKNPCNPCAAKNPCNPCAAKNPCNPCAAKNPCNPCAVKNPCNPCAAKSPCNPCTAINPCNPCAPGNGKITFIDLTEKEATTAYACLKSDLNAAYSHTGIPEAKGYMSWSRFNTSPYLAETHGGRYLNNYANDIAADTYANYESLTGMPEGSILVKDGVAVKENGQTGLSPLFIMTKMNAGFNSASKDWKFKMVMPNGTVIGTTKGIGSKNVTFCANCHRKSKAENDFMMFLPFEFRVEN